MHTRDPRFRFLTNAYVEWLGLKAAPVQLRRNLGIVAIGGAALPHPPKTYYAAGVSFEGHLYLLEEDGLCWTLAGTVVSA